MSNAALWNAAYNGHTKTIKTLVEEGANMEAVGAYGATPLSIAVEEGYLLAVKELISLGANVNATRYTTGASPLHIAALKGFIEIARALIGAGANVNAQKNDGATPLIVAVANKQEKIINLLMESSADTSLRNNNGETALQVANNMKYFPAISALSAGGRTSRTFSDIKCITVQIPHLGVTRKLPFNPDESISDFLEHHFKNNPRSPIANLEEYGLFHGTKFLICGTLGYYKVSENDLLFLRHLTEEQRTEKKQYILRLIEEMQYEEDERLRSEYE